MAPSAVDATAEVPSSKSTTVKPLQLSGALDSYESIELTPSLGREFPKASLVEWLDAPNSDDLIRDLAITISQRGVVFFRAQDGLTNDLQKKLITKLGALTGRPETSGLHIHPVFNSERDLGGEDPEISTISSKQRQKLYQRPRPDALVVPRTPQDLWHSDVAFEPVPADYTSLRLTELPSTGGDTLWASGYDIYDSISPAYQNFLEGLSVTFEQPEFGKFAERGGFKLYEKARGAPENIGPELKAVHPVVRTNPVTGWKSIFPVGGHVKHINGVSQTESDNLLKWFLDILYKDHGLQLRFKWKTPNDIAIWDNRSVFHSATYDYESYGDRFGNRVVGVGEKPFYDPNSISKAKALSQQRASQET